MANCTHCDAVLPRDGDFCPSCGQPVTPEAKKTGTDIESRRFRTGSGTISGDATILPAERESVREALLQEGEEFHGRYRVEGELGAGGMGVVYRAEDRVTGRAVALKLIHPERVSSPTAVQRFLREGLTARDIRHRNVIAMYDVGEDGGRLYLVMEYVEGATLREWLRGVLRRGEDVSFATARRIVEQLLDGLEAAHELGVVHRDLKPENIMFTGDPEGEGFQLKILDFGIARAIDGEQLASLTATGAVSGTPLYMAPEQRTAAEVVGPAADLYAVAVMLYELLLGVAPEGRWGQPSKERPELPRGIDELIDKGLSGRPRSRFQSVAEFRAALAALAEPRPRPPPPEPRPQPVPQPIEPEKPKQPDPDGQVKSKKMRWLWVTVAVVAIIGLAAIFEEDFGPGPPPPDSVLTGRWYAEVWGSGVAFGYIDIGSVANPNAVSGGWYDMQNNHLGSVSGTFDGSTLNYRFSGGGWSGAGVGILQPDQRHLNVRVTDNTTGAVQMQYWHKDHLP